MSNNQLGSVVFFLGSGVSIPSGMPSVKEITSEIRANYNSGSSNTEKEALDLISCVDKYLQCEINELFPGKDLTITYEDIYEALFMLHTDFYSTSTICNIAFIKTIAKRYYKEDYFYPSCIPSLNRISQKAMQIIGDKIRALLPVKQIPQCFDWLTQIISRASGKKDIISLNHDYLVEDYLKNKNLEYEDGMISKGQIFIWEDTPYLKKDRKDISILKLHGNINWKTFCNFEDNKDMNYMIGVPDSLKVDGTPIMEYVVPKDDKGRYLTKHPFGFLIGKKSKAGLYNIITYSDIFSTMTYILKEHNLMIIAGYGFGDEYINHRLRYWGTQESNRIVIFKKNIDVEKIKMIFATLGNRDDKLMLIDKYPSDMSETEFEAQIDKIVTFSRK